MAFVADIRNAVASERLTPLFSAQALAFLLFFLSAAFLALPSAATQGEWENTGSLNDGRSNFAATLLQNGMVLVEGGEAPSGRLASAELYDPATAIWSTTGSLTDKRSFHTATLLPDGMVLAVGGFIVGALASAELYDWATGT
jgi:galactose oxidase-like protein